MKPITIFLLIYAGLIASCEQPRTTIESIPMTDANADVVQELKGIFEAGQLQFKDVRVGLFSKESTVFTTEIFQSPKSADNRASLPSMCAEAARTIRANIANGDQYDTYHFVISNDDWDTTVTVMSAEL